MDDNLSKVMFTLLGAAVGFLSSIGLEWRKKKVERQEIGRVLAARIESHLPVGNTIEAIMRSSQYQDIEGIREFFFLLQMDREYDAFLSKIGLFVPVLIEKIMGYYDYLAMYKNNLAKIQGPNDLGRLEGYFMLRLLALECLLHLARHSIGDPEIFRSAKERLRKEYHVRFVPALLTLRKNGGNSAAVEECTKHIERVFADFKISKELEASP
jgi:hypothetical protein